MSVTIGRGLVTPLRRWDTVMIVVESDDSAVPDVLASVWSALYSMGEYGEGPSFVGEMCRFPFASGALGWSVMIDPKGLSSAEAGRIPEMMAAALEAAGIDAAIGKPKVTKRFDAVKQPNCLFGWVVTANRDPSFVASRSSMFVEYLESLSQGATPAMGTPEHVDTSWEYLRSIDGVTAPPYLSSVFVQAAELWASSTMLAEEGAIGVAGSMFEHVGDFRSVAFGLRELWRRPMAPTPCSSGISFAPQLQVGLTEPLALRGLDPYRGQWARLQTDFLWGLGWSSTMTPALWAKVRDRVGDIAEVVELEDGRIEVTFGEPEEWAPWLGGRSGPGIDAATEALRPILLTEEDYRTEKGLRREQELAALEAWPGQFDVG